MTSLGFRAYVLDSSSVLAIVFQKPEVEQFAAAIATTPTPWMSTVNWFETLMIVEGHYGAESADDAFLILQSLAVHPLPFARNR